MSTALAIPLRLTRRIKPPSLRRVYWIAYLATILGYVAKAIVEVQLGHPVWFVLVVTWGFDYWAAWTNYQREQRTERRLSETTLPPISRGRWLWLLVLVAYQAFAWATIV